MQEWPWITSRSHLWYVRSCYQWQQESSLTVFYFLISFLFVLVLLLLLHSQLIVLQKLKVRVFYNSSMAVSCLWVTSRCCTRGFILLFKLYYPQIWPLVLKSSPVMIHCISTLTFKFHLLLTIETWCSTINLVRESNICSMAYHGYCVGTN